ncbi:hypothetical protein PJJ30_18390 [Mycobacterium kansasii]|nr:hypothetical protein [Mycobacterium persicum]
MPTRRCRWRREAGPADPDLDDEISAHLAATTQHRRNREIMQIPAHRATPGAVAAMTVVTLWLAGCHSTTTGRPVAKPEDGRKDGPASTTSSSIGLPPMNHFRIGDQRYGAVHDCYVNGNAVTCTLSMEPSYLVLS